MKVMMNGTIETLSGDLAGKPIVGGSATAGTGFLAYMDYITGVLEIISLLIAISVGLLTAYGLMKKHGIFFKED